MENISHDQKDDQKDDQQKGASCNATVSTPFFIFIGLAAVVGAVLYFVLK